MFILLHGIFESKIYPNYDTLTPNPTPIPHKVCLVITAQINANLKILVPIYAGLFV